MSNNEGRRTPAPEAPLPAADPASTANLYCSGKLDDLLALVVLPAWRAFRLLPEPGAAPPALLWMLRYARRGEHLKLRWHGPAELAARWRALLEQHWAAALPLIPAREKAEENKLMLMAAPIDQEDQDNELHPDRSLLFTTYRRSHISLGYLPYLEDDDYVKRLVRCLGESTEILLDALAASPGKALDFRERQNLFIKAVLTALAALPFTDEERSAFLHYLRDVILRDYRKKKNFKDAHMQYLLTKFAAQVSRSEAAGRKLTDQAFSFWDGGPEPGWMAAGGAWARSLAGLHAYVDPICRDLAHYIDPFAESPIFPALFKAFHGFSNQLGLRPLDEAFAYHFITFFLAGRGQAQRPMQLRPIL